MRLLVKGPQNVRWYLMDAFARNKRVFFSALRGNRDWRTTTLEAQGTTNAGYKDTPLIFFNVAKTMADFDRHMNNYPSLTHLAIVEGGDSFPLVQYRHTEMGGDYVAIGTLDPSPDQTVLDFSDVEPVDVTVDIRDALVPKNVERSKWLHTLFEKIR